MQTVLTVLNLLFSVAAVTLLVMKRVPKTRSTRRAEIARLAVDYAASMGGSSEEKLAHGIGAFQRIDLSDNGKRDFTDVEARIAIEAILGAQNVESKKEK